MTDVAADTFAEIKKATSTDFMEIGSTGLQVYDGQVREEFLNALRGRTAYRTYREMRDNDPVVGAVIQAISMLMRSVEWQVEPSDPDNEQASDVATFVGQCMTDMTTTWEDMLAQIMSYLTYGWSFFEIVYKYRKGWTDGGERSRYSDGMIGWRKLAPRSQDTLERWNLDDNGGVKGMFQMNPTSGKGLIEIPIEKALLFRTSSVLNNPEGRSVLRNAYTSYYFKKRIQEIEAIGIERDLAGLPIAYVPPQLLSNNASAEETAALNEIKQIIRNIRRDEQEGVVFPLAYDPETGNLAYDIRLLSTGGDRQFDTDAIITRYDQRIAMTMLADFILLGHEKVGTQALSVSKVALFSQSLNAYLDGISSVFQNHAFPRLLKVNNIDPNLTPQLTHAPVRNVDLKELGEYVTKLTGAGAELFPDDNLEAYLREVGGLPVSTEAESVD